MKILTLVDIVGNFVYLSAGQFNSLQKNPSSSKKSVGLNKAPIKKEISFGSNVVSKTFNKKTAQVVFENAQELIDRIDESLGKGYFSSLITKENGFKLENGVLSYTQRTIKKDLFDTLKAVKDIPMRIICAGAKKFNIQSEGLQKWAAKNQHEREFNTALDIIEEFINPAAEFNKKAGKIDINIDECGRIFDNQISSNITKVKKEYDSRDERTLNRMATATVSALYSANDFYNISMLQKDDKDEAKKSYHKRFGQEITRMALSAGLTFISLSAFDRYTKKNVFLNSFVIAGSALFSEVISRIISKTPLLPLTPEQAAKIAQKNAAKKSQQENASKQEKTDKQVAFKSNLKNEQELYKNFIQKDGGLITQNVVTLKTDDAAKNQTGTSKHTKSKKDSKMLKFALGALLGANILYLLSSLVKGEFKAIKLKKDFISDLIKKQGNIQYGKINDGDILEEMGDIHSILQTRKNKYSIFDKIKTMLTKRTVITDKSDLMDKLTDLKATKEGKEISNILDTYINHLNEIKGDKIQSDVDIVGVSGLYAGLTKIVETIYTFLSAPARLLLSFAKKDKNNSCARFDKLYEQNFFNYKKELTELGKICLNSNKSDKEIINIIKKRARNVEIGAETGELANISRTMVTILSTIFFVNDYRNKVLIESGGKDIEGAREERNERIAHKLSNFIINGTLMNTFNNIFKGPLNKSLLNATLIATMTETTNEYLVRKSICQPIGKKHSREEIIKAEQEQLNKGGFMGWWSSVFRKITGKKTLTEKVGIDVEKKAHQG